jgi:hypothetical protein
MFENKILNTLFIYDLNRVYKMSTCYNLQVYKISKWYKSMLRIWDIVLHYIELSKKLCPVVFVFLEIMKIETKIKKIKLQSG